MNHTPSAQQLLLSATKTRQSVLCEKCQQVVDVPHIPPFHILESRLLRADYIPSEAERHRLQTFLKEGEQAIEQMKDDISVLRRKLEQLKLTKGVAEFATSKYRSALSVHHRVPVEIWRMIFSLCLSDRAYAFDIDYCPPKSPLLGFPSTIVSQVCSHWNTIARGMPSIWSSINVNIDETRYDIANLLQIYLSNSADHPLKLRVTGAERSIIVPLSRPQIWKMLSAHVFRSRELTVAFENEYNLPSIQQLSLHQLEIFQERKPLPDDDSWLWLRQAVLEAPKLATLFMMCPSAHYRYIPFYQLTEWHIESLDCFFHVHQFFDFASTCRQLRHLHLNQLFNQISDDSPIIARDIQLPSLRHFSANIYEDSSHFLSAIFRSLIMPSLEEFMISFEEEEWPDLSATLAVARRSSDSLKRIELVVNLCGGAVVPQEHLLLDIFRAAPELTNLELSVDCDEDNGRIFDDMVSQLLFNLEDRPRSFLPKLESICLTLSAISLSTQLVKRVLRIVFARQQTPRPYRNFQLRCFGNIEEELVIEHEMLGNIKALEECGLKVDINNCAIAICYLEKFGGP